MARSSSTVSDSSPFRHHSLVTAPNHIGQSNGSRLSYVALSIPSISGFDSKPLYHRGHIYITKAFNTGLKIFSYDMNANEWSEFYDFGYAVQCPSIENGIDSSSNKIYVVSKLGATQNKPPTITMFYGLDLESKQFVCKNITNEARGAITSSTATTGSKSTYLSNIDTMFVFGAKPNDDKQSINVQRASAMSDSIWFCKVSDSHRQWHLSKAKIPFNSSDYGILHCFEYLIFLFFYKDRNAIWCFDSLSGTMVKCDKSFPLNCCDEMRMIVTEDDDRAHFMLVNEDYAWLRRQSLHGLKRYFNSLTGKKTWKEPEIWRDCNDSGENVIDPYSRSNFHISIDLMELVPHLVQRRYKERYFNLIEKLSEEHYCFSSDLIDLVGRFTSRLY